MKFAGYGIVNLVNTSNLNGEITMSDLQNGPETTFLVYSEACSGDRNDIIDPPTIQTLEQIQTWFCEDPDFWANEKTIDALKNADSGNTVTVESSGCGGYDLWINTFIKLDQFKDVLITPIVNDSKTVEDRRE